MITKEAVIEALKKVEDPELFLDVWFLGLIYNIDIKEDNEIEIEMTFTSPMCPAGPQIVDDIKSKVTAIDEVKAVHVKVTFSPPWEPSDEVKGLLGMM